MALDCFCGTPVMCNTCTCCPEHCNCINEEEEIPDCHCGVKAVCQECFSCPQHCMCCVDDVPSIPEGDTDYDHQDRLSYYSEQVQRPPF